ncbi:MAG TPA: hypothetical protein VGF17_20365 [Phytomonospora sp.]
MRRAAKTHWLLALFAASPFYLGASFIGDSEPAAALFGLGVGAAAFAALLAMAYLRGRRGKRVD